jgi:hypothetical protein
MHRMGACVALSTLCLVSVAFRGVFGCAVSRDFDSHGGSIHGGAMQRLITLIRHLWQLIVTFFQNPPVLQSEAADSYSGPNGNDKDTPPRLTGN